MAAALARFSFETVQEEGRIFSADSFKEAGDIQAKNNRRKGGVMWWPEAGSNCRHTDFQSVALPTELSGHICLKRALNHVTHI